MKKHLLNSFLLLASVCLYSQSNHTFYALKNGEFVSIQRNTGQVSFIENITVENTPISGLSSTFDYNKNHFVYTSNYGTGSKIISLDITNGQIANSSGQQINNIKYDPITQKYYGFEYSIPGQGPNFISFDPYQGTKSLIKENQPGFGEGPGYDIIDNKYFFLYNDSVRTIDLTDGTYKSFRAKNFIYPALDYIGNKIYGLEVKSSDSVFFCLLDYNTGIFTRVAQLPYVVAPYSQLYVYYNSGAFIRDGLYTFIGYKFSQKVFSINITSGDIIYEPNIDGELCFIQSGNYSTNINEQSNNLFVNLFPNPVYSSVRIEFDQEHPVEMIEIYNSRGLKIFQQDLGGSNSICDIELNSLSNGLYFMKIKTTNNSIYTKKFLKM